MTAYSEMTTGERAPWERLAAAVNNREALVVELAKVQAEFMAAELRDEKLTRIARDKADCNDSWEDTPGDGPMCLRRLPHDDLIEAQGERVCELGERRDSLITDLVAAEIEYQASEAAIASDNAAVAS